MHDRNPKRIRATLRPRDRSWTTDGCAGVLLDSYADDAHSNLVDGLFLGGRPAQIAGMKPIRLAP